MLTRFLFLCRLDRYFDSADYSMDMDNKAEKEAEAPVVDASDEAKPVEVDTTQKPEPPPSIRG